MEKGTLVEFRVNGERRLAIADRPEGKKHWIVLDDRGQSHTIHPRQITYEVAGITCNQKEIAAFAKAVAIHLDPDNLEPAWELLVEMGETTNPIELAGLIFSEQDPPQCYAAYVLLDEDKLYFKQKGDRYEPRPPSQVAEIKHQLEMATQRQQAEQLFLDRIERSLQGETITWESSDRPRLDALEKFATFGEEAPTRTSAIELLTKLQRTQTPTGAFQLLIDLKLWSDHENLFLRRSHAPVQFPPKVTELAHHYLTTAPADPHHDRLDLSHLKVYTIDDESTQEIDDGLSIEILPDGREKIWVHIADPTRWVNPGDALDLEARRRGSTLYLPTGIIPMFPPELATGPMSLKTGDSCCALSFAVILDETGGIEDFTIHASQIKITYRLTYEDVEEMLNLGLTTEPELVALAKWAKRRLAWRQSQGAIMINMPECSIKVFNDGEDISISVLDNSFSRQLVAEMMILAGEVAGRYGQQHGLPLLFRHQNQPELPSEEELLQVPAGPARASVLRRCMPKSEMSTTPFRHASLGLESYSQVTSPIRRYSDLLGHFQIKAHLRGEDPPFSGPQIQDLGLSIVSTVQESTLVERQTNRYWGLEFLRRHGDEVWSAIMLRWLREHEGLGLVLLEDLGLEYPMRFDRSIQPGDPLHVRVIRVDPRQDRIDFQEMVNYAPETMSLSS
ncbi:MAG: ribonuclease R family protein [Synechococcales bacterium]|nr:ribonuclease R family protein [Synechococcales bacterium]